MTWQVYIILCSDNSLYTGITTDLERRFRQHGEGRGARFFRGRQPLRVVYLETGHTRSSATRREARIKAMNRLDKQLLVSRYQAECRHDSPSSLAVPRHDGAGFSEMEET